MVRHQHYATTEIYGEEVPQLLDGAESTYAFLGSHTDANVLSNKAIHTF